MTSHHFARIRTGFQAVEVVGIPVTDNRRIFYIVTMKKIRKFGIFKQKFNKPALIRQHSRALADLIGGNSRGEYSTEKQVLFFFETIVFVLDTAMEA